MTNGSSQGLFVIVAVVIFGIFVAIAYILFEDTLSPALASIFSDATGKVISNIENPILLEVIEKENGKRTVIASNSSDMEIESIVLSGKDKDINLLKNGDFTNNMEDVSGKYGEKWIGRNMVFTLDTENTVNGNPSLRLEPVPKSEETSHLERDVYLSSRISMDLGDKLRIKFDAFSTKESPFLVRLGANGVKDFVILEVATKIKSFDFELERIEKTNNNIVFKPEEGTTLWLSNIDIQYVDMPSEFHKYRDSSAFNRESGKLEVVTDKSGVYEFAMKTKSGETYYNSITLD